MRKFMDQPLRVLMVETPKVDVDLLLQALRGGGYTSNFFASP
jgi:hypothetical protein